MSHQIERMTTASFPFLQDEDHILHSQLVKNSIKPIQF